MSYDAKVSEIVQNVDAFHRSYYRAATFGGPSLYFHRRALETRCPPGGLEHIECVYAMLVSWGMHRMGPRGSKMKDFDTFRASMENLAAKVGAAQQFDVRAMNDSNWELVEEIFLGIQVMESSIILVGNSKVLHHMLPNLVPPIDREYTLKHLRGNTNIKSDPVWEWRLLRQCVCEFFVPVLSDSRFSKAANEWMSDQTQYPWDTSLLKVIDNLLIGARAA